MRRSTASKRTASEPHKPPRHTDELDRLSTNAAYGGRGHTWMPGIDVDVYRPHLPVGGKAHHLGSRFKCGGRVAQGL